MMKHIKSIIVLTSISVIIALLMAVTNKFTAPIIAENEANAANEALLVVMPEGKDFEKIDISSYALPSTVTTAYKEAGGGYVVQLLTTGYGSGMSIMCGIDATGTVTGAVCLGSSETLGYEKQYGENTVGATLDTINSVDVIAGATLTTKAYRGAVEDALKSFVIFSGGSVDTRTEEEILKDNLSAALPDANGEFEKVFVVEKLDGIDAVYSANNDAGYVFVLGDAYVGVTSEGTVIGEFDDTVETKVTSAYEKVSTTVLTEIDITVLDIHKNIVKVSKTNTGNFVIEVKGAGFGINGDEWYNPSGEYIYITLCATPEKEIVNIVTVSQKETENIGSACANKEFYEQFIGKNDSNYKEIDAISGATITTNGYTTAVGRALDAIDVLKGVN